MSVIRLLSTLNERRKPPMSNNYRELTGREKQRIKKLVTSLCANYDKEYGCLPLDCNCPMLGICFTNSALCRYFRKSVLPEDAGLEAVFTQTPTTHCKQCGKPFPTDGKRVYCSQRCAEEARRKQTAARVRKYREISTVGISTRKPPRLSAGYSD